MHRTRPIVRVPSLIHTDDGNTRFLQILATSLYGVTSQNRADINLMSSRTTISFWRRQSKVYSFIFQNSNVPVISRFQWMISAAGYSRYISDTTVSTKSMRFLTLCFEEFGELQPGSPLLVAPLEGRQPQLLHYYITLQRGVRYVSTSRSVWAVSGTWVLPAVCGQCPVREYFPQCVGSVRYMSTSLSVWAVSGIWVLPAVCGQCPVREYFPQCVGSVRYMSTSRSVWAVSGTAVSCGSIITFREPVRAMPWLRRLFTEVRFSPGPVDVEFAMSTVALEQVFLPVLRFPLSVSFHHCSILIHSSTTDVT
jgi:hypothetical protein